MNSSRPEGYKRRDQAFLLFTGFRAPPQTLHAEHGVEVLQEYQHRMEAPGVTFYIVNYFFIIINYNLLLVHLYYLFYIIIFIHSLDCWATGN